MSVFTNLICRSDWGRCWVSHFLEIPSWLLATLILITNTRLIPSIWLWQHAWSLLCPISHLFFQIPLSLVESYFSKTLTCNLGFFSFECVVVDVCIDIMVAFLWMELWGLFTLVDILAITFLFGGNFAIFSVKFLQLRLKASYWAYNLEVSRVLVYVLRSNL